MTARDEMTFESLPPADPQRGAGRRAVVIGGGLAGITTALVLAERGWDVTLTEARPRLGGRATSYRRGELTVDNGQHVFLRCCTAYRGLLERLGAGPETGMTHLQDQLDIPIKSATDGTVGRLKRNRMPAPLHLALALGGYGLLPLRDRARLGGPALALRRTNPASPEVDEQGFGPFLRKHHQSKAAVDRLWSVISTATLNINPDDASLALAAKVFRTGLLERADGSDLGYALVPLGQIHDEMARKALGAAGVTVLDSTKAEPLSAGNPTTVTVTDRAEQQTQLQADAVILAVPHDVAATLLPKPHPTGFEQLGHSPILNIHVRYDRPVLDGPFLAAVDSPAQWIFDRTPASGVDGPAGSYLAITVSAADEIADTPDPGAGRAVRGRTRPAAAQGARGARGGGLRHSRTARHVPSGTRFGGAAARPEHSHSRGLPCGCLDGHRLAGHHGKCGAQRNQRCQTSC